MLNAETKTKAAAIGSYLGLVALLAVLNSAAEMNLVAGLPDLVEVLVAPMIPALIAYISAYVTRHKPAALSPSAVRAASAVRAGGQVYPR